MLQLSRMTTLFLLNGLSFGACNKWVYKHVKSIEDVHTKWTSRNFINRSLITLPLKILSVIIPSTVSAGRIEYRYPRMNVSRRTHAYPRLLWFVWSSTLDSSNQTIFSFGIWPWAATHIARTSLSRSAAVFVMALFIMARWWSVWQMVAMDTPILRTSRMKSWISSRCG